MLFCKSSFKNACQSTNLPHEVGQVSKGVERFVLFRTAWRDQQSVAAQVRKRRYPVAGTVAQVLFKRAEKIKWAEEILSGLKQLTKDTQINRKLSLST